MRLAIVTRVAVTDGETAFGYRVLCDDGRPLYDPPLGWCLCHAPNEGEALKRHGRGTTCYEVDGFVRLASNNPAQSEIDAALAERRTLIDNAYARLTAAAARAPEVRT